MFLLRPMGVKGKCPAHYREWTQEEESLLVDLYPLLTYAEIAARLNRGEAATRYRARLLRLNGVLPPKHYYFTPAEDKFIRDNRHKMSVAEVARHLGRGKLTVANRIQRLGIKFFKCGELHHQHKYSDRDTEIIRELRDGGMSFKEIAEKFEITPEMARYLYRRPNAVDAIAREYLSG